MPTLDDEIARHLEEARRSGELQAAESYGKPLAHDAGHEATPEEFRMPFKILKDAGMVPPEIEHFKRRGELAKQLAACSDDTERERLRAELSSLEQALALRLEGMRLSGRL